MHNAWHKAWLGLARFDTVVSHACLSFGRKLRLSSDRHDLIPPLATIFKPISIIKRLEKLIFDNLNKKTTIKYGI
jgi:hypothetical protein